MTQLSKLPPAGRPVVSVYLDTRWTDEAQRERIRIFLKNRLREARAAAESWPSPDDLEWIETEGQCLLAGRRVLASGGAVGLVDRHAALRAQGGVGAILRYSA